MKTKEKSITIHGISRELDEKIQKRSRELHLSQNRTVKKILEDSLRKTSSEERRKQFEEFCGIWTKEEAREFDKLIEDNRTIDEEDWK